MWLSCPGGRPKHTINICLTGPMSSRRQLWPSGRLKLIPCPDGATGACAPPIPFGNNEQQLDQVATISFRTCDRTGDSRLMWLRSLSMQGIDRLVVLNGHGGNDFKPIIRDVQKQTRHAHRADQLLLRFRA